MCVRGSGKPAEEQQQEQEQQQQQRGQTTTNVRSFPSLVLARLPSQQAQAGPFPTQFSFPLAISVLLPHILMAGYIQHLRYIS
ncbi:hypothetical protein CGGC5_v007774 [Colletotrichum fructicola Nara gc5]|uniref:Uncharacterized protein n=1 Tax=Colletotrichum fructicola (strain Nara gc5) TaxID=1213859 RepID=A0A7J6J425_COLFN|nr:hypothetical protein CGGC5_v007774 [Colletotrichum fructicola Nara gc5]KAF4894703.1 hypothetical protein CGCFRS4_v006345 [Colletotrichum fructicola]